MKGIWVAHKELYQLTSEVIIKKRFELIPELEELLRNRKNYDLFLNILKNPPKSKNDYERITRGHRERIEIHGLKEKHLLSELQVEETIILSNIYDLNEQSAVELLLEAETQMQYFPGLTRGLTAILLYYDRKKLIVNTLKTLLLVRSGRTWVLDETIPIDFINFVNHFIDDLIKEGLIGNLLAQIELHDWQKEQDKLLKEGGLGNAKHRKQVKSAFDEIKTGLCECIFNSSCQIQLNLGDLMKILNHLKLKTELNANSQILNIDTIYLVMSILYCFDLSFIENSKQQHLGGGNTKDLITKYINCDPNDLNKIDEFLKSNQNDWPINGIKALFQFSWQVYIYGLYPFINDPSKYSFYNEQNDDAYQLFDKAMEQRVFKFLNVSLISNSKFHTEKYIVERFHNLIVDFIDKMPNKIRDLRHRNEELAKLINRDENLSMGGSIAHHFITNLTPSIQALPPGSFNYMHAFEDLLNLIGDFYSKDPLKLELCLNYWSADNDSMSNLNISSIYQKPSQKQISLFKFVRYFSSGEALIGNIYMSYVHMLTGLSSGEQSAQHCYVLLQQHGYSSNVSWNHIFYAFERYYDSLRVDFTQKSTQTAASTPSIIRSLRTITQQELHALILVTKLVNQIARHSEKSRIALCEFQRFNDSTLNNTSNLLTSYHNSANSLPIIMFGLLTCPIPVNLKGEILTLLSSLSLTPQIALNIWQALENSQVISTIGPLGTKSGIEAELDEIETREESYSLLIGFLNLIKNLIKVQIPSNLGAGLRSKGTPLGFQPYLQFLVKSVYLKILTRSYKNLNEKWQIICLMLKIFHQLISSYEINENDFKSNLSTSFDLTSMQSPGYRLTYEFLNDGPISQTLFKIINETLDHVYKYTADNNQLIIDGGLYALKLVFVLLNKQKVFVECLKNSNMNVINIGMDKLLTSISSKTNKVDNLVSIYRFIQHSSTLTIHTYYCINILIELNEYIDVNQQMLNIFLVSFTSTKEQYDIIHGFLECIEFEEYDFTDDITSNANQASFELLDSDENSETNLTKFKALTRIKVLKFLLFNLKLHIPNISHILFGFDIRRALNRQAFYLPGTNLNDSSSIQNNDKQQQQQAQSALMSIVTRNCMHSVVEVLNQVLKDEFVLYKLPQTIDLCYEILYNLCSNNAYANQILHFLRNEYDFIFKHLKQAPFAPLNPVKLNNSQDGQILSTTSVTSASVIDSDIDQQTLTKDKQDYDPYKHINRHIYTINAWILYLTSNEIQNLFVNRMRRQASKLVEMLIEVPVDQDDQTMMNEFLLQKPICSKFNLTLNSTSNQPLKNTVESSSSSYNSKIFKLLSVIELNEQVPEALNLNYFDVNLTEKVINSCKYKSDFIGINNTVIQLHDIKQIQSILMNELSVDSNISQSKLNIIQEIKSILNNIIERNQFQLRYAAKRRFIDSFKIFAESFVLFTTPDIFNINLKYQFIISLMKQLLNKVFSDGVIVELTYPIAGLIFTLMCNLRAIVQESLKQQLSTQAVSIISNNLENSIPLQQHKVFLNSSDFNEVLVKLIDYLINSTSKNIKVRTYLYGAIMNYLTITKCIQSALVEESEEFESKYKSPTKLNILNSPQRKDTIRDNYMILNANADSLLKYIATDACNGLNILTMMSLSILNNLLELDKQNAWLKYIDDNGYLACIINSIQSNNQSLEECFHSEVSDRKIIFLYETRMSLLIAISKTPQGAGYLLKNNIISTLSSCSIFNIRTKFDRNVYGSNTPGQIIQLLHQFHQIFFPVLNLCISIIDAFGCDNIDVKSQISRFMLTHSDTFLHVLSSKIGDIQMLEELKLVTSLLSKIAPFGELTFDNLPSNISAEFSANLNRIQKEILQLIGVYFMPDKIRVLQREIKTHIQADDITSEKNLLLYCVQISANISSYCSMMMKGSGLRMSLLIFSPKLTENAVSYSQSVLQKRIASKHLEFILLVNFLKYTLENVERSIEFEIELLSRKNRINDMIEAEIKQIVSDYKSFQKLLPNEKQYHLKEQLNNFIKSTNDEIKVYIFTIEKCLLLLWRHTEFYLAYYEPSTAQNAKAYNNVFSNIIDSQTKVADQSLPIDGVSKDDMLKFRQDLPLILTPTFLKRFIDLEEKYIQPRTKSIFTSVLIKRIQRLLHLRSS